MWLTLSLSVVVLTAGYPVVLVDQWSLLWRKGRIGRGNRRPSLALPWQWSQEKIGLYFHLIFVFYTFFRGEDRCNVYNTSTESWDQLASMRQGRALYGLVQLSESSFWITGLLSTTCFFHSKVNFLYMQEWWFQQPFQGKLPVQIPSKYGKVKSNQVQVIKRLLPSVNYLNAITP